MKASLYIAVAASMMAGGLHAVCPFTFINKAEKDVRVNIGAKAAAKQENTNPGFNFNPFGYKVVMGIKRELGEWKGKEVCFESGIRSGKLWISSFRTETRFNEATGRPVKTETVEKTVSFNLKNREVMDNLREIRQATLTIDGGRMFLAVYGLNRKEGHPYATVIINEMGQARVTREKTSLEREQELQEYKKQIAELESQFERMTRGLDKRGEQFKQVESNFRVKEEQLRNQAGDLQRGMWEHKPAGQ